MKTQIRIFGRIRPSLKNKYINYTINKNENNENIFIKLPKTLNIGNYNGNINFTFQKFFDQNSSQEEVYKIICNDSINSFLKGYNATIFAYGQTGSGKTYTMSGSENWKNRGIIPRSINSIFKKIKNKSNIEYRIYISYFEIYNENAYDLLEKENLDKPFEKWQKIELKEDADGNIHLKNLSVHYVDTEKDAIDFLMMGNFIKHISSTPLNPSSSRSHCIFTITLEGKNFKLKENFVSKLHLIDLAGSERTSKSQIDGQIYNEAKYINLSLTYLEQVIIALGEKQKSKRIHIPYRNSLMTTILKDSLGGNCKTTLVACWGPEVKNCEETITTLRFAQRCGKLENILKKNKIVTNETKINELFMENNKLKEEILYLKTKVKNYENKKYINDESEFLEDREITKSMVNNLKPMVEDFLNEKIEKIEIKDIFEANICFEIMKHLYNYKMKEYIKELNIINEKMKQYDLILNKSNFNYSEINN